MQAPSDLGSYGVKERLQTRWREEGASASSNGGGGGAAGDFASPQQQALFALLNSYCDLLYPVRPYPTSPGAIECGCAAGLREWLSLWGVIGECYSCAKTEPMSPGCNDVVMGKLHIAVMI